MIASLNISSKTCEEKHAFISEILRNSLTQKKFIKSIGKYHILLAGETHPFRLHYAEKFVHLVRLYNKVHHDKPFDCWLEELPMNEDHLIINNYIASGVFNRKSLKSFTSKYPQVKYFFATKITDFLKLKMRTFGIDERLPGKNRDEEMAREIARLFQQGICSKAVVVTGSYHSKILKNKLQEDALSSYTMLINATQDYYGGYGTDATMNKSKILEFFEDCEKKIIPKDFTIVETKNDKSKDFEYNNIPLIYKLGYKPYVFDDFDSHLYIKPNKRLNKFYSGNQ